MELIVAAWYSDQYLLLIVIEKWVMMCRKKISCKSLVLIVQWLIHENFGFGPTYSWGGLFSKHQDCSGKETVGKIKSEIKIFIAGPKSFPKSIERKSIKHFQA